MARWSIQAAASGATGDVVAASEALRIESKSIRLATSWKRTSRTLLGREHAWISVRAAERVDLAAGAIVERWVGPAPWEDPVAARGAAWGEASEFHSVGRPGARGVSLRVAQTHVAAWNDPERGRGCIGLLSRGGWRFSGGSAQQGGCGVSLGRRLGSATLTGEVHLPAGERTFARLGVRGPSGGLFVSSSVPRTRGPGTARIDARASSTMGLVHVGFEGTRTQGIAPDIRRGLIWVSRVGRASLLRAECRWAGGKAQAVTRAERRWGAWNSFAAATCDLRSSNRAADARAGVRYSRARVRTEALVLRGGPTQELRAHVSFSGPHTSARLAVAWPFDHSSEPFRWEMSLTQRGG